MYIIFQIIFHYKLLQDIEYRSQCYTVGPCWLSILYIVVVQTLSCLILCNTMDCSLPGFPVFHYSSVYLYHAILK